MDNWEEVIANNTLRNMVQFILQTTDTNKNLILLKLQKEMNQN